MSVVIAIRVICGFLAGLAAGILIMRAIYKKHEVPAQASNSTEAAVSAKVS